MMRHMTLALTICLATTTLWSAGKARSWQTGTWREVHVAIPKVVFGVGRRPVGGGAGPLSAPATMEVRTYVIETGELRLELKENASSDFRRIDARVGEPVTFALEKNTVYVKEGEGVEHKLNLTKKAARTKP
jgi:hypothetical protein